MRGPVGSTKSHVPHSMLQKKKLPRSLSCLLNSISESSNCSHHALACGQCQRLARADKQSLFTCRHIILQCKLLVDNFDQEYRLGHTVHVKSMNTNGVPASLNAAPTLGFSWIAVKERCSPPVFGCHYARGTALAEQCRLLGLPCWSTYCSAGSAVADCSSCRHTSHVSSRK